MKNLMVVRCGANSLHRGWLEGGERNFDLVLSPYEPVDAGELTSYPIPGFKCDSLYKLFTENDFWRAYDYICLPDDDIEADARVWSAFFAACGALKIKLAQPALTPDSHASFLVTMQNVNFVARETNYVEVMTPCFSTAFLAEALSVFPLQRSGWGHGVDLLWTALLGDDSAWVVDATAVRHTRAVGSAYDPRTRKLAKHDVKFAEQFAPLSIISSFGGVLRDGRRVQFTDPEALELYRAGFADALQKHPYLAVRTDRLHCGPGVREKLKRAIAQQQPKTGLVSRGKPSLVSSLGESSWCDDPELEASGGNDGLFNGDCGFHTAQEVGPWWQVDLLAPHSLREITIYNRLRHPERCRHLDVFVSEDGRNWRHVAAKTDDEAFGGLNGRPLRVDFREGVRARLVRIQAAGLTYLHLDEVEVFGEPLSEPGDAGAALSQIKSRRMNAVAQLELLLSDPRGAYLVKKLIGDALGKTP